MGDAITATVLCSYDLMLNLQLGIRYTLTTLSKVPRPSQIKEANFHQKVGGRESVILYDPTQTVCELVH